MPASDSALVASPFATPQQREHDRALKRQALLTAAVRMFNEHGFHASSLDDVAASLGVTKPTIYHHLGNKDQVLFECVRMGLDQLLAAADAARRSEGTGMQRLSAFMHRYAEVIMDDFGRCVARTGDDELSPASRIQFRALKRQIDLTLRSMIEDAVADGTAQVTDIRMAAFLIAGALNWAAHWHRTSGPLPASAVADMLTPMLCDGLASRLPNVAGAA